LFPNIWAPRIGKRRFFVTPISTRFRDAALGPGIIELGFHFIGKIKRARHVGDGSCLPGLLNVWHREAEFVV